ncbi:MAG: hypothetical protein KBA66_11215 [Leptospiraceae bacterium]|nr:hypothetical protein [Leptospiraceae bacterium]
MKSFEGLKIKFTSDITSKDKFLKQIQNLFLNKQLQMIEVEQNEKTK